MAPIDPMLLSWMSEAPWDPEWDAPGAVPRVRHKAKPGKRLPSPVAAAPSPRLPRPDQSSPNSSLAASDIIS